VLRDRMTTTHSSTIPATIQQVRLPPRLVRPGGGVDSG